MDEEMIALVSRLAEYLKKSKQQLECFHRRKSQVEGWFKGEILYFLDQEKGTGPLSDFDRERLVDVGGRCRRRIDIWLQFDNLGSSWVELKHWCMWAQKKKPYGCLNWYFKHSAKSDIEKLLKVRISEDGDKFMLVLCTDKPSSKGWNSGVEEFNNKFPQLSVRSLMNPGGYPDSDFFLGLLRVCPKETSTDVPREGA